MQKELSNRTVLFLACIMIALLFSLILTAIPGFLRTLGKDRAYRSIMKNADEYSVYQAFYADIYFTEQDKDYVDTVANCIDFYAPLLYDDFKLPETPDVTIIIYKDAQDMSDALGLHYTTPPMGIYYGGVINVLSPGQWIETGTETYIKERFVREGPLIHELVHLLTDIKTNGNYSIWLTEGISLYYEYKYAAFEWREDLKQASTSISIEDLEKNFRNIDESIAYRRCFDIINDYIEANEEDSLQNKLAELKNHGSAKEILNGAGK